MTARPVARSADSNQDCAGLSRHRPGVSTLAAAATLLLHLGVAALLQPRVQAPSSAPAPVVAVRLLSAPRSASNAAAAPRAKPRGAAVIITRKQSVPGTVGPAMPSPSPPPATAVAEELEPQPSPPAPSSAPIASSADDALIAAYVRRLWKKIAAARPAGIDLDGEALIGFSVDAKGGLLRVELLRSSGTPLLDTLALRSLRRAAPFPPPPPELGAASRVFSVPFHFH